LLSESGSKIKAVLALILGGDKITAEYCLLSLISRVYKKEGAFLIGNLPLNISGITRD
jgi:Mini-chromosome maintenance replisome factor